MSLSCFLHHHLSAETNLVLADLLFQGGQLVDPVIDLVRPLIEDREQ
jgi:hypothetical protein